MSLDQPTDIVLTNSVVAFDGRVLELFGHTSRIGNRIHVALITGIAADRHKLVITVRGAIDYSVVLDGEDDAKRDEVERLTAEVERAAPELQAG
jgi:hypothetical protein